MSFFIMIGLLLITNFSLSQNLIAYYPFNGNANDESGNGNHGAENGGVTITTDRFGNANSAYSFDGVDGNIIIPHDASFVPASEITISMWVNAIDIQSASFSRIYNKEHAERQLISFQNNGTILAFGLYINGSYQELDVSIIPADYEGNWVQIVATYDGTAKYLYKNGVEIGNIATTGLMGTSNNANIALGSTTGGGEYFNGLMDDVRIYNGALTASEVSNLYLNESITAYYPFNGNANDESGNGNDGTLGDGVASTTFPSITTDRFNVANSAYSFDGADDFIDLGQTDQFANSNGTLSVSAWINFSVSNNVFVLNNTNGTLPYNAGDFAFTYNSSTDRLGILFGKGSSLAVLYESDVINLVTNTWYHVAFSYDEGRSSGDKVRSYLDGIAVGTSINSGYEDGGNDILNSAQPLYIGGRGGVFSQAIIDDIGIYNRALSASEIADLYTSDSGIPTIASFTPTSGPIGTTVTITGTNFTGATSVSFGGTAAASFNVVSATSITAIVSTGSSGDVSVTGPGGTSSLAGFTFISAPTITSFTPTNGPIGTLVTITGTNFDTTPANNIVFFGATQATVTATTSAELKVTVPAGASYQPITVLSNGLIAYSSAPFVVTFFGGGIIDTNSFAAKVDFETGLAPVSVSIGDLDSDGKADFAVANELSNSVSIFRNNSTDNSTKYTLVSADYSAIAAATSSSNPSGSSNMSSFGNFDLSLWSSDQILDAIANQLLEIFTAVVNEEYLITYATWEPGSSTRTIHVIYNGSTYVAVTGTISYAPKVDYPTGVTPFLVSVGDLDGNGKADLAVANLISATVSVFRNTGTNSGMISYDTKIDYTTGTNPFSVAIGDFDGDGKADLAVANESSNTVSIFWNTSTSAGTISYAAKMDFITGLFPWSVAIGDLDGDGKVDLAVANAIGNTVSVLRNTSTSPGTISFASKVDYPSGISPASVSIGDLDGDGKADLAVTNNQSFTVSIFRNTSTSAGTISYALKEDYTTGINPRTVSIGDLDGDGKADLAVANQESNTVSIFRNTSTSAGTISFATKVDFITGLFPFSVAIGDMDGDGRADLAVANNSDNTVSVFRNTVGIPVITNTTFPDNYDNGTEPTAAITLNNVSNINKVDLMYKGISEDSESWEPWAATTDGNTYTATIAADDMIGTEFYFRVMHNTTLELLSDSGISYINYPIVSTQQALPSLSFGDQVTNYQIIAVPLELANSNVTSVFKALMPYNIKLWRLYDYANGDNREYSGFSTMDVGKGYWLIVRNSTVINPGAGSTARVSQDNPFSMTLTPGWNLIGNPYNFRISWQDVLDPINNPLSITASIGGLMTFDSGVLSENNTLDPYRGGFVENKGGNDISIDIPVLRNTTLGGRMSSEEKPSDLSEKYWEFMLELSQEELHNQLGGIGMHPDATIDGRDIYDEVSVPLISGMGFFELVFDHPEYNATFSKEIVPTADGYTWDIEVRRDINEPLDISWDNEGFGDNDKQIYLFNPATLEVVNMRLDNNYEIGAGIKNLQILFGNQEYINHQLDAKVPLFGEPYPNPTSYQIKYPFKITKGNEETVVLKVYDYSGKLIGQSIKQYQPGYYQLDWQFNRPGMYIMRLKVGEIIKTNKIIVR